MNTSKTSFLHSPVVGWALILVPALLGMALVFYATTFGPGVGGDATIYLTTARNLLTGKGLGWTDADGSFRLLPYSPPFYPMLLSGLGLFSGAHLPGMTAAARGLNILLFGLTILVTGWFFCRWTGRPWLAGLLAVALAASPVLLGVSVWAMTEPLFLFTGFAGLFLLLAHFQTPRPAYLYGSAVLVGLAFLARYIGAAFVATAGLALLVFYTARAGRGTQPAIPWRTLIFYGLVAALPMILWVVVDLSLTGTVSSRSGQSASDYGQRLAEMGPALERIYLFWLLPESLVGRLPGLVRLSLWLLPVLGLLALGGWVAGKVRSRADARIIPAAHLALVMAGFMVIYLAVLAFVQVFTYPPVTLASRMLSPVHFAALVLLVALGVLSIDLFNGPARFARLLPVLVYAVALGLAGSYVLRGALVVRDYHASGIGYTAPAWQNSPVMEAVRALPEDIDLVSNDVTALMYLAERPAYTLQEIFQAQPQAEFTAYGEGPDESQRVFREEGAALVLFYASLEEDFGMYGDRTAERLDALTSGLYRAYQGEDGAIYFYKRP